MVFRRLFPLRCDYPYHHIHHIQSLSPHSPTSFTPPLLTSNIMAKEEAIVDDRFDSEKIDREDVNQPLELQEEDDSPIEEVRVTVPSMYLLD